MALTDRALNALRRIVGVERAARDQAESPSGDAKRFSPTSTYAIWGREDIGGLLSVSQNLMDRYADYEAMNDYPDIRCFTGDMHVYVVDDDGIIIPTTIRQLTVDGASKVILAYDKKKKILTRVSADHPRLTGRNAAVLKIKLSNGEYLRVTPEHKVLTIEPGGYVEAKDLQKGMFLVGARAGFDTRNKSMLTVNKAAGVWVSEGPKPDGVENVYDISTDTKNLLVNGVVCHNSAYHYFASDATQPNLDNGRVVWVTSPDQAIADSADSLIKNRLRLEDDLFSLAYTLCQYGNCLPASTKIWLEDSVEPITNITPGDRVVVFNDGEFTTAPVSRVIHSGKKTVYRVKTRHREIRASANHPFLKKSGPSFEWVKLSDLTKGDPIVICTRAPSASSTLPLASLAPRVSESALVKLTPAGATKLDLVRSRWSPAGKRRRLLEECGIPSSIWGRFYRGNYGVRLGSLKRLFNAVGEVCLDESDWEISEGRGGHGISDLTLPESITPKFCRLYGYFLANGWTSENESNKSAAASCGNKENIAHNYEKLAQEFAPRSYLSTGEAGNYVLHIDSAPFVSLLNQLGWKNGARERRLPEWIWSLSDEHREEMLRGFSDGNGHYYQEPTENHRRCSIELSSRELVSDLKTLIDGLGYSCGNIRYRHREGIASYDSWTITFYQKKLAQPYTIENIILIEEEGEEDVFDLSVNHHAHNFVADGTVVHNSFEEVLCTPNGVVGINSLAPPTMRRIEKLNGSLIGFVQDVTGRFTANQDELRRMLAGNVTIPRHVAIFEDWQTVHFRLRSHSRRSPYGRSIAEGGRWIWKRLVMLEDAVMIYKLCLRGDSQIWTPDGRKAIKDLQEGDEVYSYTTEDKLKKTKVVYKKHNGQDKVFRVYGPTRELFANATHPVLVESITPEGVRRLDYVEVKDIQPGFHRFVTPRKNDEDFIDVGETERTALALGELLQGERLPARVFQASREIKRMILRGLTNSLNEETATYRGDREVVEDLRDLAMQAGFLVTLPAQEEDNQWMVALTFCDAPRSAAIDGVEEVGTDNIWDIGVEAEEHNFVANGIAVHNTRSPQRFAFYVDVTDVPSNRVEAFLKKAKRDLKKKKMVNPKNNFLDMRYNPLCLAGDTVVPQLDGSEKTLIEMAEAFDRGEEQWVYSTDVKNEGKFVPGRVIWAGKTRKNAQLLRITLDNDKTLRVTPDHKMIRRSGEFAEAQTLKVGDSLMPFRRRTNDKKEDETPGAESYAELHEEMVVGNHKVAKIEWLEEREDTYTLTVSPAHTFAVSAGVFVKNSLDEDFVIGVRDGKSLSRVDVLNGPDYQSVEDVNYFLRKLHGALMVPRAFMGQDAPVQGRALLSNEDSRAARQTLQVQRELRAGIEQLIRTDFAARGHPNPKAIPFEIMMTVPSNIYELAALEVKNARADFAARVQPYVSARWVLENIFKLSDDEINKINIQRQKEAQKADRLGMDPIFGSFTGGKPPSPEEQMAMQNQQLPPDALPPDQQQQQAAPQMSAKEYDAARRLEERRDNLSRRNHQLLLDKLGKLQENDREFARRLSDTQEFLEEFRNAALRNVNGRKIALPSSPRFQIPMQ